jgi:hypothetical protein
MRFPHLSSHHASAGRIWPELTQAFLRADEDGFDTLRNMPLPVLQSELFAASGAPQVSEQYLYNFRDALNSAMYSVVGFPNNRQITAEVDRELCRALGSYGLPIGEMLRMDTWCWICVHLMPHYVYWRWWDSKKATITPNRVMGGIVRNALGRLWLRAIVLDLGVENEDRWELLEGMTEDACSALLERTTISSNHRLSRALINAWLKVSKGMPPTQAEDLLRTAMVRARVQTSVIETAVLNDYELEQVALENFRR